MATSHLLKLCPIPWEPWPRRGLAQTLLSSSHGLRLESSLAFPMPMNIAAFVGHSSQHCILGLESLAQPPLLPTCPRRRGVRQVTTGNQTYGPETGHTVPTSHGSFIFRTSAWQFCQITTLLGSLTTLPLGPPHNYPNLHLEALLRRNLAGWHRRIIGGTHEIRGIPKKGLHRPHRWNDLKTRLSGTLEPTLKRTG